MSNRFNEQARVILRIPDQVRHQLATYDAKDPDNRFPPMTEIRPPEGVPNIVIALLDDVESGVSRAFAGPCEAPNFEKLSMSELLYYRFHTSVLRAPARVALLTSRNHQSVNTGDEHLIE